MPLQIRDLCVMSYARGMSQFSYRTSDTRRELEGSTYWHDAVSLLNIGDFIFVQHTGRGSAIYCVGPLGQVRCLTEWPHRSGANDGTETWGLGSTIE
jgi:hypothetical protein